MLTSAVLCYFLFMNLHTFQPIHRTDTSQKHRVFLKAALPSKHLDLDSKLVQDEFRFLYLDIQFSAENKHPSIFNIKRDREQVKRTNDLPMNANLFFSNLIGIAYVTKEESTFDK